MCVMISVSIINQNMDGVYDRGHNAGSRLRVFIMNIHIVQALYLPVHQSRPVEDTYSKSGTK